MDTPFDYIEQKTDKEGRLYFIVQVAKGREKEAEEYIRGLREQYAKDKEEERVIPCSHYIP